MAFIPTTVANTFLSENAFLSPNFLSNFCHFHKAFQLVDLSTYLQVQVYIPFFKVRLFGFEIGIILGHILAKLDTTCNNKNAAQSHPYFEMPERFACGL